MLAVRTTTTGLALVCALLLSAQPSTAYGQNSEQLAAAADADGRELLSAAEAMLARNDARGAYALLKAQESRLAGNVYFDYLLGIAALDTGRISEAVFSLRRAISVEPRFAGARMELARAYYDSGDYRQARPLFIALLAESPPPGVRNVIDRYIAAIDQAPTRPQARFLPYLEVGGGDDSNANASTASDQFLGFMLNPNNVEAESSFFESAGGFSWLIPDRSGGAWYLNSRLSHRRNDKADFVDATVGSLQSGFTWRGNTWFGRAGAEGFIAHRNDEENQRYLGVDVLFGRPVGEHVDLILGLRGGGLNHEEPSLKILDVGRVLFSAGFAYRSSPQSRFTIDALAGRDSADQDGSPYGNHKAGLRLQFDTRRGDVLYSFTAGLLKSDYDGPFFGVGRDDKQVTAGLQVEFRDVLFEGLSVLPRVRYVENESDILLYDYDRTEVGVTIRWSPR